ncbi:MAG: hypothetical protein PUB01_00855 [Desulfovibrionaceae bacterium]|nr:hypothetical protein [Desulfovibrionaceae bacterium]
MSKCYDPQMHTAEHIMNRTMVLLLGCDRSFSSHLNAGKSKCDYHFHRDLTDAEAGELERRVNGQIGRSLPVYAEYVDWATAETLVDVAHLPSGVDRSQPLRLVRVGDYDVCACIGEHVENTAQIGAFRLVSHSFTPGEDGRQGVLRLRFKVG